MLLTQIGFLSNCILSVVVDSAESGVATIGPSGSQGSNWVLFCFFCLLKTCIKIKCRKLPNTCQLSLNVSKCFLRQLTGKVQVTCSTFWLEPAIWEYCRMRQVLKMVKKQILYVCTGFQGIHKMMCYVSMHVFKTNMPILISNA